MINIKCSNWVSDDHRGVLYHQCRNNGIVERSGDLYCGIHDPEYIKEKQEKRDRMKMLWTRANTIRVATEGLTLEELQQLTPSLCRVAPKMYEACKKLKEAYSHVGTLVDEAELDSALDMAVEALAKVDEEVK